MYSSIQITGLDIVDGKVEGDGEECWDGGGGGALSEEAWPSIILAPVVSYKFSFLLFLFSPCFLFKIVHKPMFYMCKTSLIMYISHVIINALSAHIIHINLNTIFNTYVEVRMTVLPKQFT